ncbi:MAG: uroporphyrinogen-III synthase [Candidatus Obscuribacterales bacterium]|nr:uroporphyrinogen-III synthase [Candidatus Obscuribacterales bacterium]
MSQRLDNQRILVTRAGHQAGSLSARLRELGASVVELPLLRIGPPDSWSPFDQAFQHLSSYDWLLFASVNAVECTVARLNHLGVPVDALQSLKVAAIGPATGGSLVERRIPVCFQPNVFVAEEMILQFPGYPDSLSQVRFLWPKADIGRLFIKNELQKVGAEVETVTCYRTCGPENPQETARVLRQILSRKEVDIVTLTSSETVRSFDRILRASGADGNELRSNIKIAVIGPETAATAAQLIGGADIQAREYTIAGLVQALADAANSPL